MVQSQHRDLTPGRGRGFPGFRVYMALTQGDTQMPQEQAARTHRRPADREEGK